MLIRVEWTSNIFSILIELVKDNGRTLDRKPRLDYLYILFNQKITCSLSTYVQERHFYPTVSIITLVNARHFDNSSLNPSPVCKAVHCSHVPGSHFAQSLRPFFLFDLGHSFYLPSATLSIFSRPVVTFTLLVLLEQITSLPLRPMTNDLPDIIIKMSKNA